MKRKEITSNDENKYSFSVQDHVPPNFQLFEASSLLCVKKLLAAIISI